MAGVIDETEKETFFDLDNKYHVCLKSLEDKPIKESKELTLSSKGFGSEEEAWDIGKKVKDSLLVACMKLRIGVDAGKDKPKSSLSIAIKEKIHDEHKVKIIDNVHGLTVYDEVNPVKTFTVSGIGLVSPATSELFGDEIKTPFISNIILSNKETLALELYGASHYEKSDRARFLTLILALESLLEPKERDEKTIKHVEALIEKTNSATIPENEKKSILGSLKWLYTESISQSIKRIVNIFLGEKEYAGMSSVKFVTHCYKMRSKLVHEGKTPDAIHLGALAAQLNVLISDLLQRKIYA